MTGFKLHPEAYRDIEELWEFIAEDSLDAADRVRDRIHDSIRMLASQPYQGHRRTDLTYALLLIDRKGKAMAISGDPGTTAIANITVR